MEHQGLPEAADSLSWEGVALAASRRAAEASSRVECCPREPENEDSGTRVLFASQLR